MTHKSGLDAAHAAVRAYAARHGVDRSTFATDGAVALTFDARYRVRLRPASNGRIALTSTLMDLDGLSAEVRDEVLASGARIAAGLLRDHPCTLAVDPDSQRLVLQQVLPTSADADLLEAELADFVNVLAFWSRSSFGQSNARAT